MENLNGQIKTDITLMGEDYDISVEMPTGKPLYGKTDYKLTIYNEKVQKETPKDQNVSMLAHIVASYNEGSTNTMPDNFYLQLSPPADLLPTVKDKDGKTTFAINSLSIKFSTGHYTNDKLIPGAVLGTYEDPKTPEEPKTPVE